MTKVHITDHHTGEEKDLAGTPEELLAKLFSEYGEIIKHYHQKTGSGKLPSLDEALQYIGRVQGLDVHKSEG